MAGEWIKVRTNLWDDPRIAQLVEITDQSEAAVIGGLYWLWATADEHSSDGLLHGMTTRTIDRKTGVAGLGNALVSIGWLSEEDGSSRVVRFDEHNGSSAKNRADTARRVANHRNKKEPAQAPAAAYGVTQPLPRPVRSLILARDAATCVYCQRKEGQISPTEVATDGRMHIDHVIPVSRGGSNDPSNLVCACGVCNRYKGNRTPDECGLDWPVDETGVKRGSNVQHVTDALPREDKIREEEDKNKTTTDASAPAAGGGDVPTGSDDFAPPAAAPLPARQDLPAPTSPAGAICVALRPLGVGATTMNPIVIGWAERGVAIDVLVESVRIAREHKADGSIPPQYLAPIVERLLNPPERRTGPRAAGTPSQKFNFAHVDRSADVAAMQAGLAARGVTAADLDDDSPL